MARASISSAASLTSSSLHIRRLVPVSAVHATNASVAMPEDRRPHPSIEVVGGARDSFLPALKTLHRPYDAYPIIAWNRHVETIFAAFFRSLPNVRLRRECLRTKDNGTVALDWVSGDDRRLPSDSPLLILLPGLTGGSQDTYVRHMLLRATNNGWRVVVFNSRGCGDSPVTTPQFYSASFIEDLCEVVAHVGTKYPNANLYAIGWSLGANILVRYLGQEPHNCLLSGAVSLCNPFNLLIADEDFHKGFNNVYDKALANSLCKIFKKHALLFEDMGGEYDIQATANAKSVREFDEGLTRVSFGFKSVDDYYSNSSSSDSIKHVRTPLLCIQAANDPIAPARGIPRKDIQENPNCLLIVTPKGGHLGWVAGSEAPLGAPWTDPLVMDFLEYLERGRSRATASCSDLDGAKKNEEGLHQLEV
ncbi:Embryogenesis-associated protein [Actinidia chinensis var. chinensis]|uniref:Embryogenesis-associated protein n=1 Tax=Actinidia chinensis var. chinensis TaxID=1590841 RepID=A0A2R6QMU1_ACTCC|nr:Embryogenesis-associated protein [Actinidia chinensis var. chinensis]